MKKIIALLLCLAMLFSLAGVAMATPPTAVPTKAEYVSKIVVYLRNLIQQRISDAASRYNNGINYVALGDSTSMGYYVGDEPKFAFSCTHNSTDTNLSGEYSEYKMFSEYLAKRYPSATITGADLSLPGCTSILLRGILDKDFREKQLNREFPVNEKGKPTDPLYDKEFNKHIRGYIDEQKLYSIPAENKYPQGATDKYSVIQDTFVTEIKKADIITYDMMMMDCTLHLVNNIQDVGKYSNRFETLMESEDGYQKIAAGARLLRSALTKVLEKAGLNDLSAIAGVLDALLYSYAKLTINFSKNVEWIYKNNKDVKLIVVGPSNLVDGITAKIGGVTIDLGRIWDCMNEAIMTYLIKGDPHADWYHLADCTNANETYLNAFAQGKLFSDDADYAAFTETLKNELSQTLNELASLYTIALTDDDYQQVGRNIASATDFFLSTPLDLSQGLDALTEVDDAAEQAIISALIADLPTLSGTPLAVSGEKIDDFAKTALALYLAQDHDMLGLHASAEGYKAKFAAIKAAYNTPATANATYRVRLANFALNSVGAMLGSEKSKATVTTTLTKLLTPIVDLKALKGLS